MSVGHRFPFLRVVLVLVLVVPRFVSFRCDRVCCPRLASGPRIGSPGWFAGSETRTNERLCRAGTKGENRTHPFFGGSVPPSRVRARSFVSPSSSTSSRANGKRESRCRPECPARACDHGSFSRCGSVRFGSVPFGSVRFRRTRKSPTDAGNPPPPGVLPRTPASLGGTTRIRGTRHRRRWQPRDSGSGSAAPRNLDLCHRCFPYCNRIAPLLALRNG